MTLKQILLVIVAVVVLIGLPIGMIWSIVDHIRHPHRERRGGSSGYVLGPAIQELDRLIARPSVEHIVEAENRIERRDDDQGDPPTA